MLSVNYQTAGTNSELTVLEFLHKLRFIDFNVLLCVNVCRAHHHTVNTYSSETVKVRIFFQIRPHLVFVAFLCHGYIDFRYETCHGLLQFW